MEQEFKTTEQRLDDVYYVLFRRKWIILCLCLAGFLGAAVVYKVVGGQYSSQAKLLVRFVLDSGAMISPGGEDRVLHPDSRGDNIVSNEREILTSFDLARQVAELVGPGRILGSDETEPGAADKAAIVIVKGLDVGVAPRASIINITFAHSDPIVSQLVLNEIIQAYLKRHAEIHFSGANYDMLSKQTDELRLRLRQTEMELHDIRSQVGGVGLDESKASLSAQLQSIRAAILDTESELAAQSPRLPVASSTTDGLHPTHPAAPSAVEPASGPASTSQELSYAAHLQRIQSLRAREQEYLSRFTEDNPLVKSVRSQIAEVEQQLAQLAVEHPDLVANSRNALGSSNGAANSAGSRETESPAALRGKLSFLTNQLELALSEARRLNDLERSLAEVLRRKQIEEENYTHLATSLERERFDAALESTKLSNIIVTQEPSPPLKNSKHARKLALMILAGVAGGGVCLVFLFDLVLDPRLKWPTQLAQRLGQSVYISIPNIRKNGVKALQRNLVAGPQANDLPQLEGRWPEQTGRKTQHSLPPLETGLRSYCEALRDGILVYFERVNLRRKPKLIGLAACHGKAGVTTISKGLAATLSETGGGKVLLVDLNHGPQAMQEYLSGHASVTLPDMLENVEAKNQNATGNDLYLASFGPANDGLHPTRSREFDLLIPKLKASDFDYIVFDMPPLTPTSVTFRVAGFLDKMLVVAEAERTHLKSLQQSVTLLEESGSRVSMVMNRTREYFPRWLRPPQ